MKIISNITFLAILVFQFVACDSGEKPSIQMNQVGYYPEQSKKAVIINAQSDQFYIVKQNTQESVFTGTLSDPVPSPFSDKTGRIADFTDLTQQGTYELVVPGGATSYAFEIGEHIYKPLADGTLKAFYFQRASTALPEQYAGKWARAAGHPDDEVLVHASAASESRPEGTVISSTRGWYDAGDYNKYIVNSGISMYTLMSLYEEYPGYFDDNQLSIPENANDLPDLLDEVLWNLRWMLTMQDPQDGGVYHKLTTASFDGMVMPDNASGKRYVVQKSTAAALNFAAVMAQANRVFTSFKDELPGLADSCLAAAEHAWQWSVDHPEEYYDQNAMNEQYDPDIVTGAYGDNNVQDEFTWAAIELFITSGNQQYLDNVRIAEGDPMPIPSWNSTGLLGYYTMLRHEDALPEGGKPMLETIKANVRSLADNLVAGMNDHIYQSVMGKSKDDFMWGSNSHAANQAIALVYAYKAFAEERYLEGAMSNLDYLLGRNATGYSFVTGFGDKPPMNPHHRPSEADGIEAPVPGLLVGGPNPGQQDGCTYPSDLPDESYIDDVCSYASNEITINWNAPMAYLAYAVELLEDE